MNDLRLPLLLACLVAAPLCSAQGELKWGGGDGPAKQYRTPLEGTRGFYDEAKVKKEGDLVSVTAYASSDPARTDGAVDYAINCKTEEIASKTGAAGWEKPIHYVPGEALFNLGKKFCDWTSKPGFWKRLSE